MILYGGVFFVGIALGFILGLVATALRPREKPRFIKAADLPPDAEVLTVEVCAGTNDLVVRDSVTRKEIAFAGVGASQAHVLLNARPDGLALVKFVLDGVPVVSEEVASCP